MSFVAKVCLSQFTPFNPKFNCVSIIVLFVWKNIYAKIKSVNKNTNMIMDNKNIGQEELILWKFERI